MNRASVPRVPVGLVFLAGALSALVAGLARGAQPCPSGPIANFKYVTGTSTFPRQITYRWDAPADAPEGTVYQVLRGVSPDYCTPFQAMTVIDETAATTDVVTLETPDRAYEFWVRVKGCENVAAPAAWTDDSFTTPPSVPTIAASVTGPEQVTLTLTQNDSRATAQVIERAGVDGVFRQIFTRDFSSLCPAGSAKTAVDANVPPGTYAYRAWSFNGGTSQLHYLSNVVTVSVGTPPELAPVINLFRAEPAVVLPGQPSRLSWSTDGAADVTIDPVVGSVPAKGSVTVFPEGATTYTLTARAPGGAASRQVLVVESPTAATLPAVVSALGLQGAHFRTDVQLNNPSPSLVSGSLVFRSREWSGSDGDPSVRYSLGPGETKEFPDVLAVIGVTGSGSLDVVPERGDVPVVRARVYNDDGANGTSGASEDALSGSDALQPGDRGVLLAPSDFLRFRFSIGLRTLASDTVLTFALRDATGSVLKTLTRTYPGTYTVQRAASDFFEGFTFSGNESVTVELNAGAAFVYATTADNRSNSPTIQVARRIP